MKKGYKETKGGETHDKKGLPIWRELPPPTAATKAKRETNLEEQFRRQANKPVNWGDNLRTARYKHHDFVSIEALYRAFKTRLLNELEETSDHEIEYSKSHPTDPCC